MRPLKQYGKPLADVLAWWRDYLLWHGHDPNKADGCTTSELEMAIRMLMFEGCVSASKDRKKTLLEAQRDLERVLARSPWGDTWDLARQTRIVDAHRAALIASATARHPFLGDYLTRAREYAQGERDDLHTAGQKLAKEMDEGTDPLHARLRKMVNGWRNRKLLPRDAPQAVRLHSSH